MLVREPVVAGRFYPAAESACRSQLNGYVKKDPAKVEGRIVGGVVPHAGWMCSGQVAGAVFSSIAADRSPETLVLLGAVHRPGCRQAAVFPSGQWETPLGPVQVDSRLAERLVGHTNLISEDPYAHEGEHSLEVQVPFVRALFPEAKIVPIMVPPDQQAARVGEAVGRTLSTFEADAVVLASTDLTHYGPSYGFTPQGASPEGCRWAKEVNDRRLLERIEALEEGGIVAETKQNQNACGGGAVAAAIAAVKQLGAARAVVLEHTSSREVLGEIGGSDSVGYAGVIFVAGQ